MRWKLKGMRVMAGYSSITFADAIGYSQSHYSQVETGDKNPSLKMALAIKRQLGYTDDDLFVNTPHQHRKRKCSVDKGA